MRKLFALPLFNFFKATGCFSYLKPVFVVLTQSFKILLEGIDQSFASSLGGTLGKSHSPCVSFFLAANGTDNDTCLIELS